MKDRERERERYIRTNSYVDHRPWPGPGTCDCSGRWWEWDNSLSRPRTVRKMVPISNRPHCRCCRHFHPAWCIFIRMNMYIYKWMMNCLHRIAYCCGGWLADCWMLDAGVHRWGVLTKKCKIIRDGDTFFLFGAQCPLHTKHKTNTESRFYRVGGTRSWDVFLPSNPLRTITMRSER